MSNIQYNLTLYRCLPNVLFSVIGAFKCSTTSLAYYLSQSLDIQLIIIIERGSIDSTDRPIPTIMNSPSQCTVTVVIDQSITTVWPVLFTIVNSYLLWFSNTLYPILSLCTHLLFIVPVLRMKAILSQCQWYEVHRHIEV